MALIAHQENRDKLLKSLQDLGAVEVVSTKLEGLESAQHSLSLSHFEEKYAAVREALETLRPYDEDKPSFLTPKPPISRSSLVDTANRFDEAQQIIGSIKARNNFV